MLSHSEYSCSSCKVFQYQSAHAVTVPFAHTSLGAHSFCAASPEIWNFLPPALCSCSCPDTFRRHLKTHYFQQAFLCPSASDWAFADIVCVYKFHLLFYSLTYLLTYLLTNNLRANTTYFTSLSKSCSSINKSCRDFVQLSLSDVKLKYRQTEQPRKTQILLAEEKALFSHRRRNVGIRTTAL